MYQIDVVNFVRFKTINYFCQTNNFKSGQILNLIRII